MYELTIAIMSVFAVLGVMNILGGVCEKLLRKSTKGKLVIYVESDAETLEGEVRTLLFKNPTAKIVIKNAGKEGTMIAKKLARENSRIHLED